MVYIMLLVYKRWDNHFCFILSCFRNWYHISDIRVSLCRWWRGSCPGPSWLCSAGRLSSIGCVQDSFLSLPGWHKGVAWINGFNLGRYWPVVGPQKTLYVPGALLRPHPAANKIVILEQDQPPCFTGTKCQVEFVDIPDIDGDTPLKYSSSKPKQSERRQHFF